LVIDDGSDPETRAAYAGLWKGLDGRFRLIELGGAGAPGVGPSVARNIGIEASSGAILTFCDDDDFWTSASHLAAMAEVFEADPEIDVYIANQSAMSCNGAVERSDWLPDLIQLVQRKA